MLVCLQFESIGRRKGQDGRPGTRQVGKRDFGLNERLVHSLPGAGDKQFVCPRDGEEQPERDAYQQDGIGIQITATQRSKLDQPFPIHLLSSSGQMLVNDTPHHTDFPDFRATPDLDYVSIRSTN